MTSVWQQKGRCHQNHLDACPNHVTDFTISSPNSTCRLNNYTNLSNGSERTRRSSKPTANNAITCWFVKLDHQKAIKLQNTYSGACISAWTLRPSFHCWHAVSLRLLSRAIYLYLPLCCRRQNCSTFVARVWDCLASATRFSDMATNARPWIVWRKSLTTNQWHSEAKEQCHGRNHCQEFMNSLHSHDDWARPCTSDAPY